VYDRGVASTVHSFSGLSTAELPWRQVIDRSAENSVIRDRVKALDIIVWDEASMSSQRMFELVNFLHHELANDDCKNLPFAGKQMVLIGEFLQLQSVPNLFDEGRFMFYSPLFDYAASHRFGLTTVIRQQNPEFLAALAEIREGECSIATEQYLTSLQRQLLRSPVSAIRARVQHHIWDVSFFHSGEHFLTSGATFFAGATFLCRRDFFCWPDFLFWRSFVDRC